MSLRDKPLPHGITDFRDENDPHIQQKRSKRRQRTFTLSEEAVAGLQLLARTHNDNPEFGHQNSVSDLIERIGSFDLLVVDPRKSPKLSELKPKNADLVEALRQRAEDANA